ncbi:hypothetical protein HK102_007735, partial [Quaeritorhiza haematococci]
PPPQQIHIHNHRRTPLPHTPPRLNPLPRSTPLHSKTPPIITRSSRYRSHLRHIHILVLHSSEFQIKQQVPDERRLEE